MEHPLRVMILDAEVDALSPLYRLLSGQGWQVASYSSPWGACEYAAAEQPDAILTSLGFKGCEGLEIVRLLRTAAPRSRIIVFAPARQWPSLEEVAAAGADTLLSRPRQDAEILLHLHDVLEGQCAVSST